MKLLIPTEAIDLLIISGAQVFNASGLYTNYKALCLGGGTGAFVDLPVDTIHCGILSGTDYTENLATDQDWDDVGLMAIATCYNSEPTQALGAKTTAAGVFDNTADITFTGVAIDGTKVVDALVHFKSSGVITTDMLICFHDGFTAVTPNGGDIVVAYHASGIFSL